MIKIIMIIIGIVILLYGLLLVYMYFNQERMLMYPEKLPADFLYNYPGKFSEHTVRVNNEVSLNALLFQPEVEPKGRVLYFHGNTGELDEWGEVAPHFTRRGYELFIIDYRGFGKSTGKITSEEDLHEDAEASLSYIRQNLSDLPVYFYGRSLGSGIAARLATRHNPEALLLETPYNNMLDVVKHHVKYIPVRMLLKYRLETDKILPNVQCPVFIVHGSKDPTIPYNLAVKLRDVGHRDLHFFTASRAQHNNLVDYMEFGLMLDTALGPKLS